MKTLKLIIIGTFLFLAGTAQGQVAVSVNIGTPPPWGPVGYNDVRYYYLPDVEAYYDIQTSMFIYSEGGVWVHRGYLPGQYRGYDLYGGYKVPMSGYRGNAPYSNFREYRTRYARGYRGGAQRTIAERPARGNPGARVADKGNPVNKGAVRSNNKPAGRINEKVASPGNERAAKEERGHEEGKR